MPGVSLDQQFERDRLLQPEYRVGLERDEHGRSRWTDFDVYYRTAYDEGVPRALAHERFDRLRAQSTRPYSEPCPLDALPDVPARYVMCADDRLMNNVYWRTAVPERLGVDPIVVGGGHSPMAARADEIVKLLTA
jgi:hypothetical protein